MATNEDDIYNRILNAKATGRGQYFSDGKYRVVLEKMQIKRGYKGLSFIFEGRPLTAQATQPGIEPSTVGSLRSYVVKLDKPDTREMAEANVKEVVFAVMQLEDGAVTPVQFQEIWGELFGADGMKAQPMKGKIVDLEVFTRPTTKGGQYAEHKWRAVKQTSDEIKAERKKLEA